MYDRILQILLESSAARRAETRATIAGALAANPKLADRLYNQPEDPLAKRAAVAAKKAKAQRVQSQGQSQSPVRQFAGSRKDATAAGYKLTGTTGVSGSRQPRIAPGQPSIKQKLQAMRAARAARGEQEAAPSSPGLSPGAQRLQRKFKYSELKRRMKQNQQRAADIAAANDEKLKQQKQTTTDKPTETTPANIPFNRGYSGFLRGARAALSSRRGFKMPDTSIVTNAFSVGSGSSNAPITPGGSSTRQTKRGREARGAAVKGRGAAVRSVLGALTTRGSMHSSPSYKA